MKANIPRLVSVAPMINYTDRHFRYLMRLISKKTWLYTEMISTQAILKGPRASLLHYDPIEYPLAVQLGGNDPTELAECAKICEDYGYDEINLNVGCPSDRVQAGLFGACLMLKPHLVAECVQAMKSAVRLPVTVKTRLGVDEHDSYEFLYDFVSTVAASGCDAMILHARKAWLNGLSPKENRTIPPLSYPTVTRVKHDFPQLPIIINGGLSHPLIDVDTHAACDGVMIGRIAYQQPMSFARVDAELFGDKSLPPTPQAVMTLYCDYIAREMANGVSPGLMTRHLVNIAHGLPGAKPWRQKITQFATAKSPDFRALRALQVNFPAQEVV
jgi:tRNA-dihydrouridine synthase A